jgi:hypothetical protein
VIVNRPQRGAVGDNLARFDDKEAAVDALDPAFGYGPAVVRSAAPGLDRHNPFSFTMRKRYAR